MKKRKVQEKKKKRKGKVSEQLFNIKDASFHSKKEMFLSEVRADDKRERGAMSFLKSPVDSSHTSLLRLGPNKGTTLVSLPQSDKKPVSG